MTSPAEVRVNRANTLAFVKAKPTTIVLKPQERVRTATGGFSTAYVDDREPQTFRIIDISDSYHTLRPLQRTIDGIERTVEFILLGTYDAEMRTYDYWVDENDSAWEITTVWPDNGYERRATVVRHGD